eukprot:7895466-Alexandrium_andersonii.AAC.1
MDEQDYGPLEDIPPDTPAPGTGAPAPDPNGLTVVARGKGPGCPGTDGQGDVDMQQGQEGRAQ